MTVAEALNPAPLTADRVPPVADVPAGVHGRRVARAGSARLREARETQGVSAAELARRTGAAASDVLDFEAGRVIPAEQPFAIYMRALGFTA